jgi:WhiB family redox-sensing transcriptional regulator
VIAKTMISWKQQARCLGVDPEVFYPDEEDEQGAELAKQICDSCPVCEVCLEHAIGVREKWGIWGGLTARERRRIIRRRRRSA